MVTEDRSAFNLALDFSSSLPLRLSSHSHCFLRESTTLEEGRSGHTRCSPHSGTWMIVK